MWTSYVQQMWCWIARLNLAFFRPCLTLVAFCFPTWIIMWFTHLFSFGSTFPYGQQLLFWEAFRRKQYWCLWGFVRNDPYSILLPLLKIWTILHHYLQYQTSIWLGWCRMSPDRRGKYPTICGAHVTFWDQGKNWSENMGVMFRSFSSKGEG